MRDSTDKKDLRAVAQSSGSVPTCGGHAQMAVGARPAAAPNRECRARAKRRHIVRKDRPQHLAATARGLDARSTVGAPYDARRWHDDMEGAGPAGGDHDDGAPIAPRAARDLRGPSYACGTPAASRPSPPRRRRWPCYDDDVVVTWLCAHLRPLVLRGAAGEHRRHMPRRLQHHQL